MVLLNKSKKGVSIYQKWFFDKISYADIFKVVEYHHFNGKLSPFFFNSKFYSLETLLLLSEEDIFKNFSSTVKNEIRRSIKDGGCCSDITIDDFLVIQNAFAKERSLKICSKNQLNRIKEFVCFTGFYVDNELLVCHSYILDNEKKIVRLLHSASVRSGKTDVNNNIIGRGNKELHYFDMIKFKKLGYTLYDWGGYVPNSTDKVIKGINNFKLSFGCTHVEYYKCSSILYKLFFYLNSIL